MKTLRKIATGLVTTATVLYWQSAPVFAVDANLCPDDPKFGNLCKTGFKPERIVAFIVNAALFIAFVSALVFLIYGGIRWIVSGGDKEGTAKAKGTVTSALIGLAIVLAAWIILNIITTIFGLGSITSLSVPVLNLN